MTKPTILITPLRSALLAGHHNELDILVRVQAPPIPDSIPARTPINLALVIDRSGSMHGQPLEEAKRCAAMIVDSLAPDDQVSLVSYDNQVSIDAAFGMVRDRKHLHRAIRSISSRGTTALYDGWYEGAGQAALGVEGAGISRVLLLSDGQANEGLTDFDEIASRCAGMADVGVTTSTYGLGHGFNEDLMIKMARYGMGNSYYGQTAEDLMDPFREEFELLQNLCGCRLNMKCVMPAGVSAVVLNRYAGNSELGWRLPDLAYGGEAWAALRLKVPRDLQDNPEPLLRVILSLEDMDGNNISIENSASPLPWLSDAAFAAIPADELVNERFGELRAADIQDQARQAARRGDWGRVEVLFSRARKEAESNPWLVEKIDALQDYADRRESELLAKEAHFSAHRMRNRLADSSQRSAAYDESAESSKAAYLRRKREQGKKTRP